jgi:hypothetical protein
VLLSHRIEIDQWQQSVAVVAPSGPLGHWRFFSRMPGKSRDRLVTPGQGHLTWNLPASGPRLATEQQEWEENRHPCRCPTRRYERRTTPGRYIQRSRRLAIPICDRELHCTAPLTTTPPLTSPPLTSPPLPGPRSVLCPLSRPCLPRLATEPGTPPGQIAEIRLQVLGGGRPHDCWLAPFPRSRQFSVVPHSAKTIVVH